MPLSAPNQTSFTPATAATAAKVEHPKPFRNRNINRRTQRNKEEVEAFVLAQGKTLEDANPLLFFAALMIKEGEDINLRAAAADRVLKYTYGTPPKTPDDQLPPAYNPNAEGDREQRQADMLALLALIRDGHNPADLAAAGRAYREQNAVEIIPHDE